MSPVKTIKTFRDLLSFLTIIPVGGKEDFVFDSAEHMYLFPLMGGFIGVLAASYFFGANYILRFPLGLISTFIALPTDVLAKLAVAAMTVAFLLVITGLQHFDGLIDLGNAFGHRKPAGPKRSCARLDSNPLGSNTCDWQWSLRLSQGYSSSTQCSLSAQ